MAETLGSLVDKLTIKSIREYTLTNMLEQETPKFPKEELREKLALLKKQKDLMYDEVDAYIQTAFDGKLTLRDEKIKLYNNPAIIGQIGEVNKISKAIEGLAQKNFELWNLEDEARREDVSLEYIGEVKRKIDLTNQGRNDFIDKIDELFEESVRDAQERQRS